MKTAFEKLHDYYKTHDAIALTFNVSRQNITSWKKKGIPDCRALEVEKKTKGAVSAIDVLKSRIHGKSSEIFCRCSQAHESCAD